MLSLNYVYLTFESIACDVDASPLPLMESLGAVDNHFKRRAYSRHRA